MFIQEIATDLTIFTLSNVNDAISFKPQLCFEVPRQDYQALKENYINFTGTSIRKNRSRLYFLPTNVSDELQKLNPSIPEDAKVVPNDGRVYYKNRLISELDYENVKRVETACAYIAYTALNSFVHFETETPQRKSSYPMSSKSAGHTAHNHLNLTHIRNSNGAGKGSENDHDNEDNDDDSSPSESVSKALRKGTILGFRELGHLVGITPWHFHRVFKVITGLTIREYGQLCVEFIKKNQEIIDTCKIKVEQIRPKQHFSCLDDDGFLRNGSIQYAATENVVLLHEYFIDPNKSKEFKTRKSSTNNVNNNNNNNSSTNINLRNSNCNYSSNVKGEDVTTDSQNLALTSGGMNLPGNPLIKKSSNSSDQVSSLNKNGNDEVSATSQRSEIRKRRSSVMYGRMQRAAQNSITSNSLLYECLTSPPADLKLSEYCLTNGRNDGENDFDNGNDTDTSAASSVWEHQNVNMFPPAQAVRSASPSISSRKNSIISVGSIGAVAAAIPKNHASHKVTKRKSISSGNNLDALQSSVLHRRNRSDGASISLQMEPLQAELSLDSRLSLSPREYPTEFNTNVFGNFQSPVESASNIVAGINPREDDVTVGDGAVDFRIGDSSVDYNLANIPSASPTVNNDNNVITNPASMTDISLFDNSLADQQTPNTASAMNMLLDTGPLPLPGTFTGAGKSKEEDIQLDAILSGASLLDGGLTPSLTTVINPFDNRKIVANLSSNTSTNSPSNQKSNLAVLAANAHENSAHSSNFRTTTTSYDPLGPAVNAQRKDQSSSSYFFNTVADGGAEEDGLLFDTSLTSANESFLLPRDSTSLQQTTATNTANSNEFSAYDF